MGVFNDSKTFAEIKRECCFIALQDFGVELAFMGGDGVAQQLPACALPETGWINIEPGQLALAPGGKALHLSIYFSDDDVAIEEAFILAGLFQAQVGVWQTRGLQFKDTCGVVDGAQAWPVVVGVSSDVHRMSSSIKYLHQAACMGHAHAFASLPLQALARSLALCASLPGWLTCTCEH